MLSSFMQMRKQEESWGRQVPALKRVGEACVNQRSDMRLYVWRERGRVEEGGGRERGEGEGRE